MRRPLNVRATAANSDVELQPLNANNGTTSSLLHKSKDSENNDKKKVEEKKQPAQSVSLLKLFRYATGWDRLALIVGCIVSMASGAGWPLMSTIFGGLSNTFLAAQSSYGGDVWDGNDALTGGAAMTTISWTNSSYSSPDTLDQISKELFLAQTIKYCLQYTYLGCGVLIAGYLQISIWITVCERMMNKIREEFFGAILRQEIAWFDEKQSGTLVTQLSDNMERIKEGTGDKFGLLIQYVAQFFSGFVIALLYSWKLTLVMMALTPLMALSAGFMDKMISTASRREQQLYSVAGAIAEEVLSCIRTVIAFNGQKREAARYENALQTGKVEGVKKSIYSGLGMGVVFLIMFSSYGLAFWFGSTLIASGEIPRGTVFTVLFSVMMGSFALGGAGPSIALIATAKGSAHAIFEIIDRKPLIDSYNRAGKKLAAPRGRIEFKDVSFQYPTRPDVTVLKSVSITAEPGQTIALVGSSGCGKSTIVNLLLRYYDATSGSIRMDGEPIASLNLKWLRNLIGVVSQEPILFDATVEENIRFGRQNVTHSEMIKVCRMANAHDFIAKLPQEYHTVVGERGTQLSGGQKQRIAIARALVRDPKILLLDEATSALDSESESIVQEALEKAAQGRTTIVIAHRLSTIRNADKIIVMANGEVKEVGTHAELISKKQLYHDLITAQLFQDTGSFADSDAAKANDENGDSGATDEAIDSPTKLQQFHPTSRQFSRQISGMSAASETLSNHSSPQKKPALRLSGKAENERDSLKREMEAVGAKQSNFWQIFKYARSEWCYIFCGLIFGLLRGLIMPAFSFFYSELFNTYAKTGDELLSGAMFWSLMFLGLGIIEALTWFFSATLFGVSGENITMRMRLDVFKNVLRQDVAFFDDPKHSTGKICTRLATDAPNVKAALDFRLANVLSAVVSMVAGLILAFFFGWKMALLVLAIFPLVGFGGYIRMRLREGGAKNDSQLLEEAGKTASQAIENVRTVQALTREKAFYDKFVSLLQRPYRESIKQAHIQAVSYGFSQAIFFFMYAASFRFGAYLVGIDDMTPVDVYRVFFAINFSGMAVGWATAYFPEYMKARFSAGLIFKMLDIQPKIDSDSAAGLRTDLTGQLSFNDVYFNYPTRVEASVLKGVSFRLEPGQTMALVGKSGCGKSTVVALLERFYDVLDGKIMADGVDVRTINVGHLRSNIALVSQEPVLFDCSIKDNIGYGIENVTFEEIIDAAKRANIHEFIDSLPEAYNTRVGEKGTQLSGGQKQRVAIARALVRSPRILLLDEATSALDTESEKIVQEALDRARQGRTCIIIAHRLSTVQNADTIAVVHNGRIVEQGSHTELVAQKGVYYELIKKQNLAV